MIIDFHSHDFPDAIAPRAMATMCRQTEGVLWPSGDGTMTNHLDSMARTMVVDSATCQFFINLKDNAFLDHTAPNPRGYGYAVFGHVTKGLDVVDKIAQVRTGSVGYFQDVPIEPVVIKSVKIGE